MKNASAATCQPNRRDPRHADALHWARAGWEDARNGRGFRPEYETADAQAQGNYEIGRIQACNVLAAGLTARAWAATTKLPTWLGPVWEAAADKVGNARCDVR